MITTFTALVVFTFAFVIILKAYRFHILRNKRFKFPYLKLAFNIILISCFHMVLPIIGLMFGILQCIYHLTTLYIIEKVHEIEQEESKVIVGEIDPIDVIHELTEEYMDLENQIIEIVNSPKPHSKEQVMHFVKIRNRQFMILEQYRELQY